MAYITTKVCNLFNLHGNGQKHAPQNFWNFYSQFNPLTIFQQRQVRISQTTENMKNNKFNTKYCTNTLCISTFCSQQLTPHTNFQYTSCNNYHLRITNVPSTPRISLCGDQIQVTDVGGWRQPHTCYQNIAITTTDQCKDW